MSTFQRENIHPVIVVFGPTGSGKTSLSIRLAKEYGGEIISVDARQIYREMDIGTGKVTPEEMGDIPHYMIDILSPEIAFSVVEFQEMARKILADIHARGKIPILCGGTGLYLDSLILKRSYARNEPDWTRRNELKELSEKRGNTEIWEMLRAIDPESAMKIHKNNIHGVIRAIEVFESTGRSKAEIQDVPELLFPTLFVTPYDGNREKLYTKIDTRVGEMFREGLADEVRHLRKKYPNAPGLKTIGYKEVIEYLDGTIDLERCRALVAQHNRNYAKRQITWNTKYSTLGKILTIAP